MHDFSICSNSGRWCVALHGCRRRSHPLRWRLVCRKPSHRPDSGHLRPETAFVRISSLIASCKPVGNLFSFLAGVWHRSHTLRYVYLACLNVNIQRVHAVFSISDYVYPIQNTILYNQIGLAMGMFLTVQYGVSGELTPPRWRALVIAFPSWVLTACVFSLVAYLVPDWRKLHLISAIIVVPCLASWRYGICTPTLCIFTMACRNT